MPKWDPAQYAKFLKDRTMPAVDLANRLAASISGGALDIIDIGCGPGNSTKVLKDRFPDAKVTGADNSPEMLAKARETYPGTDFIELDAAGDLHELSGKYDIVFSNACLQWLPDHRSLLPRLAGLLKPGGTLAVQIPMQLENPVHVIFSELAASAKWKGKFAPRHYNNLTTEEYYDVLSDISDDFEIWEITYCHHMPGYESIVEWYKGTGLKPYLEQLPPEDADEFIRDVLGALKLRYSTRKTGEIMFRFPRLFFTVTVR